MKILVLSDSHGKDQYVFSALYDNRDSDVIIHLGDGANDIEFALEGIPELQNTKLIRVRGNCDLFSTDPVTTFENIGGHRFYITHGYAQQVKRGVEALFLDAHKNNRDVALFGHTHRQFYELRDNIHLYNPGSIGRGEYGIITIEGDQIEFEHCSL